MKKDENVLNECNKFIKDLLGRNEDVVKNRMLGIIVVPVWENGVDINTTPAGSFSLTSAAKDSVDMLDQALLINKSLQHIQQKMYEHHLVAVYNAAADKPEKVQDKDKEAED